MSTEKLNKLESVKELLHFYFYAHSDSVIFSDIACCINLFTYLLGLGSKSPVRSGLIRKTIGVCFFN